MPWWLTVLDSLGALAALLVLTLLWLFARRRWLSRLGGTFECSVRTRSSSGGSPGSAARGWVLGLGRYSGDELEWFRVFSFSPRPRYIFDRSLEIVERRRPSGPEAFALYSGHVVVRVLLPDSRTVELAMGERALTGFLAWTEASPPGPRVYE